MKYDVVRLLIFHQQKALMVKSLQLVLTTCVVCVKSALMILQTKINIQMNKQPEIVNPPMFLVP